MDSPEKLRLVEPVDIDAGRTDIWTAETAARETARLLNLIPEELPEAEAAPLKQFAVKIGENLVDEIEYDFELQKRAGELIDQAFDLAYQTRERIIDLSPSEEVGAKRAFVLPQFIGRLAEHYTDGLLSYNDYSRTRDERWKELDATIYLGRGFRDALSWDGSMPDLKGQYETFLSADPWVFANYFKGYFIGKVGIGDENGVRIMEAVDERLTIYRAPEYHPGPEDLDILYGKMDRVPSILSEPGSYLPFVAWAATLEEKAGLSTDTKERFDNVMRYYGYIWDGPSETYQWIH